ncbi:MAG: outer membrane protein assembly factor BamD [Pyrinomonadaceae bacterium]
MRFRFLSLPALCAALCFAVMPGAAVRTLAQAPAPETGRAQSDLLPIQRLEVMRQRLETMRRTVNGAVSGLGDGKKDDKTPASLDDPRTRLKSLEKEAASVLSDVANFRGKQERAEKYDVSELDRLESAVGELNTRVDVALRETAEARRVASPGAVAESGEKKKKAGFFGRLLGRGDGPEYQPLIDTVAPGRDRELFEQAAKYTRKSQYETARLLFNVIITTYPESNYLPLAKLAIADTFYREGTTSALIQAAAAYRDWLTFFPTDPLAAAVMLKMAEAEMRQMGLADRDVSHATKAEVQLKAITQSFPDTPLRAEITKRLNEVQENLAMHNLQIARFYYGRNENNKGGLKGAQSRLLEIARKYPNFSYMDEVFYKLGTTYMLEEEPDEAAKYYQQLARDYPNSEFVEKASEQLGVIGAPVPEADPIKKNLPAPIRPSFTSNMLREVIGSPDVTVTKDGVLISGDDEAVDLLATAIERGGVLPAEYLENPSRRSPSRVGPAPVTAPANRPAPVGNVSPAPPEAEKGQGITIQPTRPGAPAGTTPAGSAPSITAPQTGPATTPPPTANGGTAAPSSTNSTP